MSSTMVSPEARAKLDEHLSATLPAVRPSLFHLANILREDAPAQAWDTIICDDTGGRLPTRFIRRALQGVGALSAPRTVFINASKISRQRFTTGDTAKHLQDVMEAQGHQPQSALIISEATESGRALEFIRSSASEFIPIVNTAAVASLSPLGTGADYVGGAGVRPSLAVADAFEREQSKTRADKMLDLLHKVTLSHQLQGHIPSTWGIDRPNSGSMFMTGLISSDEPPVPISVVETSGLLDVAYAHMDELAEEYIAQNKNTT